MAKSITGQDMSGWLWQPSDTNTRFNSYDPKTGQWSAGSLAGWTRDNRGDNPFVGMTDEVANYLRAMGFTGDLRQAATDSLMAKFGGGRSGLEAQNDYMASNPNWEDEIKIGRNTALDEWLQANGLTLQQGIQQTPGASQQTMIQRLVDAQGNPVAVDAFNNRYSAGDRFTNAVQLGLAAAGVAGAGNAAGLWDLGATGATGMTPVGGGGYMAGGGGMIPTEVAGTAALESATPYIAQAMAGGTGEIGALTVTSAGATKTGLTAAEVLKGLQTAASVAGTASQLSNASSGSEPSSDPYDNKFTRPDGPATPGNMGNGPTVPTEYINQAPPTWWDTVKDYGSTAYDLLKSNTGQNLAGAVGAIAGAASGGGTNTATSQSQIDPRMAQYLYGTGYGDKNSLLGAAQDWWKQNQSGLNPTMQQGLDQLKNLYSSPAYTQGYEQMRGMGQGLLSGPIAGNPFTQGLLAPPGGGAPPQTQNPQGLLGPNVQVPKIPAGWSI